MTHPDVHRYFDGELPRDALPPEAAAEAAEWEEILGELARLGRPGAPPWLEARVMHALPAPAPWQRIWRWLLAPQSIRLRPAALALALLALGVAQALRPAAPSTLAPVTIQADVPGGAADDPATVYVQFVFFGTNARSVAVAGDFNGWDAGRNVLRPGNGDGIWTGLVALTPGVHKYMFVIDGDQWVTDPRAGQYVDDGFGMQNAVIAITPPAHRST